MAIKVGDIVEYKGKQQRVMGFSYGSETLLKLSHESRNDRIHVDNVTLIESFVRPNIKIGDSVRILKIPTHERKFYNDANKPIDNNVYEVIDVWETPRVGTVVDIRVNSRKRHYMAHYVEKINDYDII